MTTTKNNILFVDEKDITIEKAAEIKLSELKTGQPRFFEDSESYCDLYMISRVHINKTDFILTPLWGDEKGFYHSKEGEPDDRLDIIVPMNHNVFRSWLASDIAEYKDGLSVEDSPHNLTAEHVYLLSLDSDYIHDPETKVKIEHRYS